MEGQKLPEAFVRKMKELLGEEADDFFKSYEEERRFGLRKNPLKANQELDGPFSGLKRIPWAEEGYYYEEPFRPGRHPLHEAGCFYIQEPSAMAVAEAMAPRPGEKILDLCAAPGGKSTHLAGKMDQKGLLICNEIHPARAKILSQNVERMGIGNAVVTNMEPAGLVPAFLDFFDGIVVDAPCSGEGMFRKDQNARSEWSPDHVALCADRQDQILDCASKMVRPGGRIVYSTCTFSPEENEQTVARFLERHPEFQIRRTDLSRYFSEGRPEWADGRESLKDTVRIWPHKTDGEGHFLALLIKDKDEENPALLAGRENQKTDFRAEKREQDPGKKKKCRAKKEKDPAGPDYFYRFCRENLDKTERLMEGRCFQTFGDNLYLMPEDMPKLSGIKVLRPGLHVGTQKKGRMEPSHALALFLRKEEAKRSVEIGTKELAEQYLRGEVLTLEPGKYGNMEKGWVLVTAGGFSIGWAKFSGGVLKNHYPKGLRRMGIS